jgi:hypothetical protein
MTVIRDLADFAQDITPSWRDHIAAVKAAWPRPRHRRGSPSFSMDAGACLRGALDRAGLLRCRTGIASYGSWVSLLSRRALRRGCNCFRRNSNNFHWECVGNYINMS